MAYSPKFTTQLGFLVRFDVPITVKGFKEGEQHTFKIGTVGDCMLPFQWDPLEYFEFFVSAQEELVIRKLSKEVSVFLKPLEDQDGEYIADKVRVVRSGSLIKSNLCRIKVEYDPETLTGESVPVTLHVEADMYIMFHDGEAPIIGVQGSGSRIELPFLKKYGLLAQIYQRNGRLYIARPNRATDTFCVARGGDFQNCYYNEIEFRQGDSFKVEEAVFEVQHVYTGTYNPELKLPSCVPVDER